MDSEDDLLRPAPPRRYQPGLAVLSIPQTALTGTLSLLQRRSRRECGVLWYGLRDSSGSGRVMYVVAPRQSMSWGNYSISAQALAEVVNNLPNDWKCLAQIHSHPGYRVEHSNYDDRMISSRKVLSIVFPSYGRPSSPFPIGIGIHEWQVDYWHLLDDAASRSRVRLTDGHVKVEDLR